MDWWESLIMSIVPFLIGYGCCFVATLLQSSQKKTFRYIGIIHQSSGIFRLTFPDLPECVTVADSLEDLHHNAKEVLLFHLETLLAEKQVLPKATTPQVCLFLLEDLPEAIGFWVIRVELSK